MTRFAVVTLLVGCCMTAQSAVAQPYYARGSYYAGSGATWGFDAGNQLYDDGLHGDGAAGDGIYAATITSDQPPGLHEFKIANADWSQLWPHNPEYVLQNARLVTAAPGEVVFFRLDTTPRSGWQPESGAIMTDHGLPVGMSLELMGSAPELGSWTLPIVATMQGGVWSAQMNLADVGTVEYKFRSVGSWDWSFGPHYNMLIGANFSFQNTQAHDRVIIAFDTSDGRASLQRATPVEGATWGRLKQLWN